MLRYAGLVLFVVGTLLAGAMRNNVLSAVRINLGSLSILKGVIESRSGAKQLTLSGCTIGPRDLMASAEYFHKSLQVDTDNCRAYAGLGKFCFFADAQEEAVKYFKREVQCDPQGREAHMWLLELYNRQGAIHDLVNEYVILELRWPLAELGNRLRTERRLEEALIVDQGLITLSPDDPNAYLARAHDQYWGSGELTDAVSDAHYAIRLAPDFVPAFLLLSHIFENEGDSEQARYWCERAKSLGPLPNNERCPGQ